MGAGTNNSRERRLNPVSEISLSSRGMADLTEAVVQRGVPFRFTATGSSMTPSIRNGDVITVSPLKAGLPHTGQVVAFRRPDGGRLVVHRLVRKKAGRVLIRGDRSPQADGWIPVEYILGVVTAVERRGRHVFWPWGGPWALTAPVGRKLLPARYFLYRAARKALRALR